MKWRLICVVGGKPACDLTIEADTCLTALAKWLIDDEYSKAILRCNADDFLRIAMRTDDRAVSVAGGAWSCTDFTSTATRVSMTGMQAGEYFSVTISSEEIVRTREVRALGIDTLAGIVQDLREFMKSDTCSGKRLYLHVLDMLDRHNL